MAFQFLSATLPSPILLGDVSRNISNSNTTSSSPQLNTNLFGLTNPNSFDFSLLFEDSFLTIVPAAIFLVAATGRIWWLGGRGGVVLGDSGRGVKVAFLSAFIVLQLVILLLWSLSPSDIKSKASVPAASLDFAAAGILFILSFYEHSRSVAPSILISVYLAVTLPFDIARTRTLFLLSTEKGTRSIGTVLATSTIVKFGVLVAEAASKRDVLIERYRDLPPEATSNSYSRSVFWWVNPLLQRGYLGLLDIASLYPTDESLSSTVLRASFQQSWMRSGKTHKYSLLRVVCSVLKWYLLAAAIPRLFLIGLRFAQPFLIQRTVDYVSHPTDQSADIGWGLVGGYALVYSGLAILGGVYSHLMNRIVVRIRGGLVSLIYQKTMDLSITSLEEGAAITLMSADVESITDSALSFQDIWGSVIEVAISLYLLSTSLGAGAIAPGICCLLAALATTVCTKLNPGFQKVWMEGVQARISFTASMLGSMRNIKLLGLSNVVGNLTQRLRVRENHLARKLRYLIIVQVLFQNIASILAPVVTFAVYVIQANSAGKALNTATAFEILSLLTLLEAPLALLVRSLPGAVRSLGSFDRIQKFMNATARQDDRLHLDNTGGRRQHGPRNSTVEDGIELEDLTPARNSANDNVIELRDSSFGWNSEKNILHDINLRVKKGSLLMIIGPTGCGKSTLLKGILGETPSYAGFVYMATKSIAFGDQNPWTINSTIRAGICGESRYDESLYQEVIDCCCLREDLNGFPKGDLTAVGSKGISLSGGQKHRLALARAVFARKDILILDDVFSGLDAGTEEHIFRGLFTNSGPLRRYGTTVILVTHAVARLAHADWVVALSKDGTIAEQGNYENIRQAGGYVTNLAVQFKHTDVKTVDKASDAKKARVMMTEVDDGDDMIDTLIVQRTGDWTTYKHYLKAAGYFSFGLASLWCLLYIGCIKTPGLLVNYFTGPNTTASSNKTFMIIFSVTSSVSVISILLITWHLLLDIIPKASNGLHEELLYTVMGASLYFFTSTDSGITLNRFSQDLNLIDNVLPHVLIAAILQLALFLIGGGLMVSTASYFAATIPFVIFTLVIIQRYYLRTSRQMRILDLEGKAPLYTQFQESLSGLISIRAFGWVEQFCEKNLKLLELSQRPFYLMFCIQQWLAVVLDLMVATLATLLMITIVLLRKKIDPGLVGLGLLNVMSFNDSMSELIKDWTHMETSIGAIARLRDFSNNTESEDKPEEFIEPDPEWPRMGSVEIRNFAASYSQSSDLVLRGINLNIKSGEKLGICGRTGSGKSSLLASLLRMLEFRDGSIYMDGQDISFVPRDLLRQRLNVIPQEPYWITSETIRFNLDPWGNGSHDDEALIEVLARCQIWTMISEKGGLDVKMDGDFLSHGQRQLFCLARSLLKKSKVVILDEISASVDVPTDRIMQAAIRDEFKHCTIISVAHRLNTIVDFDRVAVLQGGIVVECDEPQKLLAREGSRFKELYEM